MNVQTAARLADSALAFVAADPELTGALLAASGASADALRQMAEGPDFAVFLLDFLLENDQRVLAFAAHEGVAPDRIMTARQVLGGGDEWS